MDIQKWGDAIVACAEEVGWHAYFDRGVIAFFGSCCYVQKEPMKVVDGEHKKAPLYINIFNLKVDPIIELKGIEDGDAAFALWEEAKQMTAKFQAAVDASQGSLDGPQR